MAALNIATQIPANINSLERLIAWGLITAKAVYPDNTFNEFRNSTDLVFQMGIAQCGDDTTRLIMRAALELDPDWDTSNLPMWMSTKEVGNIQIPARYLRQ